MRTRLVASGILVILTLAGSGRTPTAQESVFRAGVETVALTATVQRANGAFVPDLTAVDFRVFEDGVEQAISFFEAGTTPIDLVLLMDTSASMKSTLAAAERAATTIVASLTEKDRASIVSFGDRMRWRSKLTTDHVALEKAIASLAAAGTTPLYDALYITLKDLRAMRDPREIRRRAMVVLSDGDDTASLVSYDSAMEVARSSDIAMYTVILRNAITLPSQETRLKTAEFEMKAFARETGARSFMAVAEREDLGQVYSAIGLELSHQYLIGYVPRRAPHAGAFHRISVTIPGAHDSIVRTRSGYLEEPLHAAAK
jgi:VWFA-related protein